MGPLLAMIENPADLKKIPKKDLPLLAHELRSTIIDVVSQIGGHLAPSLGAVELVIALHYVLDLPTDSLIWDMGYQGYAHKLLTGRRDTFKTLRTRDGLCGFSNKDESEYDLFTSGHAGTAISTALGVALARQRQQHPGKVVSFIGDAALGSGMAFEALNHAGHTDADMLVILNDNKHSIARSVGSLSKYLNRVLADPIYNRVHKQVESLLKRIPKFGSAVHRAARRLEESLKSLLVPGILFEELGFRYFGPIDGHDINGLIDTLDHVTSLKGPRLLHVITTKGKGYESAEAHPEQFHRTPPFVIATGQAKPATTGKTFTNIFSETLIDIGTRNDKVVAITAAMSKGTGLAQFEEKFPDRLYDVGIAEQHGVGLASGLSTGGLIPVVAIYSSFLQRAFDQIMHDACLQHLHMVFGVDRAGLVGTDGPTHHGAFDIPYLRCLPHIVVMAPKDAEEVRTMLEFAVSYKKGPVALRYARDIVQPFTGEFASKQPIELGKAQLLRDGADMTIIACGSMVFLACEAARALIAEGIDVAVINARFIKPLDKELITTYAAKTACVLTIEEGTTIGGLGSAVMEACSEKGIFDVAVACMGMPDEFVDHAERDEQLVMVGLTVTNITATAKAHYKKTKNPVPRA